MSNSNILIVEDEHVIAFTLKEMLADLGYTNADMTHSYNSAKKLLYSKSYQLAILDINLGDGFTGIDLAKHCISRGVPFFYLSSYNDQNTLDKAISTAPGSYVIKPFMEGDIYAALKITLKGKSVIEKTFNFKNGNELIRIPLNDIQYLKADGVYTEIRSINTKYLYRKSLQGTLEEINSPDFIQTHRSYVVNKNFISKIKSNHIILSNDIDIPISRTFKEETLNKFNEM